MEIQVTPFSIESDKALYSIGQVADLLTVKQAFLRRLDSEKVIEPVRSEGGQRRYSHTQIELIQKVVSLTSEGFTLTGIRRLLELERQVLELKSELNRLKKSQ